MARGYNTLIKTWGKKLYESFSPLVTYEVALNNKGFKSVPFVLNNFDYQVLINFYCLIYDHKVPYTDKHGNENRLWTKLYTIYQDGIKNNANRFCENTRDFLAMVAWLDRSRVAMNKKSYQAWKDAKSKKEYVPIKALDAVTRRIILSKMINPSLKAIEMSYILKLK